MGWVLAIVFGVVATVFYAFSGYDMVMTLTDNSTYLAPFPDDLIVWIQGFPIWRKALWGATIGFGFVGGLLLFVRARIAAHLLFLAFISMVSGLVGHDLMMADGARYYGEDGLTASVLLTTLAFILAIMAYILRRRPRVVF